MVIAKKNKHFNFMVGERIKTARKEVKITQQQLSKKLGFKDRQILSNIESGFRKVSSDELLSFMESLKKPLEYFTDPYLITGKQVFSWRAQNAPDVLDRYEGKARKLVAAHKRFADLLGKSLNPILPRIALTKKSSFEDARKTAGSLVEIWGLGDRPAKRLAEVIEAELKIHIFHVDAPPQISGAACTLPDANLILINRNEVPWRRNYDLAHELFHVLTRDSIPLPIIDISYKDQRKAPREEKLAENFAAALLMPQDALKKSWEKRKRMEIHSRISKTAQEFEVSGIALFWRLRNLEWLSDSDVLEINDERLKGGNQKKQERPGLYSKTFVKNLYQVLDKGLVSLRKAAELLECNIEDIEELRKEYMIEALHKGS